MLIFAMDQLIVLKGVRVHSPSVLREEDGLGEDDNKHGITNGEAGRQKKKNKVTTN